MTEPTRGTEILWVIGTVVVLFYALIPVVWIVSLSFKTPATIGDQKFFPTEWTWDNYSAVFSEGLGFNRALFNSIGIAMITTLLALTFAAMAAYAITRLDFPGKTLILAGRAGGLDVPGDLDRRRPVQRLARRPASMTRGPA